MIYKSILAIIAIALIFEMNSLFHIRHHLFAIEEYGQFHGWMFEIIMCCLIDTLIILMVFTLYLIPKMFSDDI